MNSPSQELLPSGFMHEELVSMAKSAGIFFDSISTNRMPHGATQVGHFCATGDGDSLAKFAQLLLQREGGKSAHTSWQPIETAPKDNKRLLYMARFNKDGKLIEIDINGRWQWDTIDVGPDQMESGYFWTTDQDIGDPTHWAYQDEPLPYLAQKQDVPCIACDGSGSVEVYESIDPATRATTVDCQECKGNGYTIEPEAQPTEQVQLDPNK